MSVYVTTPDCSCSISPGGCCWQPLWPGRIAWLASSHWLQSFAYHVGVDPLVLIGASVAALAIFVFTVLAQNWRTAILNPAVALRYE